MKQSTNGENQPFLDLYQELPDPSPIEYKRELNYRLESNPVAFKELFFFGGIVYNLHRLGLCHKEFYPDWWMPTWWNLWESGFSIREGNMDRLCKKFGVDLVLVNHFLSPDFFRLYEQAKNKFKSGI